ncbi:thaumatin-like protein 1 [Cocos nucifera]|uniref:Thaumatin-like protein 1 n=1 Tax=Cocos nucifera TaxID=13894 RepID=A0A8K0I705_COCNU|nr:thaumatin-like protein 1 [Cocos nucifera]
MASSTSLALLFFPFLLLTLSHAATFDVVNQCSYTVWAAWAAPGNVGGGQQLNQGQTWTVTVNPGTAAARIWPRTGCSFDANGNGQCQSGDCGKLACTSYGSPPNTLAEFALNQNSPGYYTNLDFIDISLVQGFNVPMDFRSTSASCSEDIQCTADVVGQCPSALKVAGGCDDPCTIFKTAQYCCPSGSSCEPTTYSQFFKRLCPRAFSYPDDNATSQFTCPGGTNYRVTFCP